MVFDRRLPRGQQGEPYLLRELGADGLGALAFSEAGEPVPRCKPGSVLHLAELLEAAERFEAGMLEDRSALRRLLEAGSTPGGARPKALVASEDGEWIAKFPSRNRDGRFDVVGLEAVAMELARAAGWKYLTHDWSRRARNARCWCGVSTSHPPAGGGT